MRIWLNVAEAAEYAGVCRDTIYTAVERGELRHVRIASRRSIRLKSQWLDEWRARRPPSAHGRTRSRTGGRLVQIAQGRPIERSGAGGSMILPTHRFAEGRHLA
jgi:excisionase family DNA binding protein